ncbi:MAG: hypothetical protein ABSE59_03515 [Opitutaceae bacterium]|jgi:hypothetical protein
MNKKVLRALNGPSATEVTLGALLSLILGVALAALYLTFKPVSVVNKLPDPNKREEGMVYYLQGGKDVGKDRLLLRKQQLFVEGNSITLTEDELNAWLGSNNPTPKKPEAEPPPEGGDAKPAPKTPLFTPNELNFRILTEDGKGVLQIGYPCTLDMIGLDGAVIVQMRGDFRKAGDIFVYEPTTFLIGSLPAQRIPALAAFVLQKIYAAQQLPDEAELLAAWKKLENVTIEGNSLRLTMAK